MKLSHISMESLHIPFKQAFQHASAVRTATAAVLVKAKTEDNIQGVGEGCPRYYVTGETLDTAYNFFNKHRACFLKIDRLDGLKAWIDDHQRDIDKNPAAFCAVELALLNVLARQQNQSLETLLLLPELSGEFCYTGVLGVGKPDRFEAQLQQYLQADFTNFKIKVVGDKAVDQPNIAALKRCGRDDICVRLDANNLWSDWVVVAHYIKMLDYPFQGLEEPLGVRQYDDCRKLYEVLGIPIILDESFINQSDFDCLQKNPEPWIINIRISKMGGILRSLAVAEKSSALGIPIIIGAQVGETSILTRAALTVANRYRNILLAQEGAFGTWLLEKDVVDPPLCFGRGGILKARELDITRNFVLSDEAI